MEKHEIMLQYDVLGQPKQPFSIVSGPVGFFGLEYNMTNIDYNGCRRNGMNYHVKHNPTKAQKYVTNNGNDIQ